MPGAVGKSDWGTTWEEWKSVPAQGQQQPGGMPHEGMKPEVGKCVAHGANIPGYCTGGKAGRREKRRLSQIA